VTIAAVESGSRNIIRDWRLQLVLVLLSAIVLRTLFFVGFGLGDDLGYIGHADSILAGHYPPLDPLNQYAYRPLLLYLFAGGIALFGHTDVGVIAPVFLAAIVTTALVFVFVRKLVDPDAAWWCALLYAFEPFNVVNSTTMTNDVILACLTFAAVTVFLVADRAQSSRKSLGLFAAAGLLMLAAFLVKVAFLAVLCALVLYSLVTLRSRPREVLSRQTVFYATLLLGLLCVCLVYYVKKGDFLWQFKAETFYYETYKPEWYRAGVIDYATLMWQYPRSLFGMSGYRGFRYLEHGLLFWLVVPASVLLLLRRGNEILKLLVLTGCVVFAFFEFYPQYLSPRYLPLVRQDRYLELLLPAAVIIGGTALHSLWRRRRVLAAGLMCVILLDSVVEAARRFHEYDDSQQDMRELARYAGTTIARAGGRLVVDLPASNALTFYLRSTPVQVEQLRAGAQNDLHDCYVAVGGARSFWWTRDLIFDILPEAPPHWILTYQVPGAIRPWRLSNLRVYFVSEPSKDWYALFDSPQVLDSVPTLIGLTETAHAEGFDRPAVTLERGASIPDLGNATPLAAPRLQWDGWMRADGGIYSFEVNSDDGSWIELNDKLLLDNGGTHPARLMRRTVRLAKGWYRFRLRYEDTGGDRLLHLRVYKNYLPAPAAQSTLFFSFQNGETVPSGTRR
jgi:4-amino-4-deoxy-L-arabinose transferase-like glycosyltransferase